MIADLAKFEHPLDAMYLIHKALRAEADRVRQAVTQLEMGGSFKPFMPAFYHWALALGYYTDMKDQYIATHLTGLPVVQDRAASHQELETRMEELQTYLHEDLARTIVIPRTQRQLLGRVIALQLALEDVLEDEEERLVPIMRERLTEEQQVEMVWSLLHDQDADDAGWVFDWVAQDATAAEQQTLRDLAMRMQRMCRYM